MLHRGTRRLGQVRRPRLRRLQSRQARGIRPERPTYAERARPRVRPGDTILVHAGTYKYNRYEYTNNAAVNRTVPLSLRLVRLGGGAIGALTVIPHPG